MWIYFNTKDFSVKNKAGAAKDLQVASAIKKANGFPRIQYSCLHGHRI